MPGGAEPSLLTLPGSHTPQGVSILARRRQPAYVLSFLLALGEIMAGATACAQLALGEMSALAGDVQARWQERRRAREAAEAAAAAAGEQEGAAGEEEQGPREYFLHRQRQKAAGLVEDSGGAGEGARVELSDEQRALMLLRKRRLHAAASLAQTAVDCCGPLALSSSLQVQPSLPCFYTALWSAPGRCLANPPDACPQPRSASRHCRPVVAL